MTARGLLEIGIDSQEKLAQVGPEQTYLLLQGSGHLCEKFNAVYLYAFEGAIGDYHWREVPPERKAEFKEWTRIMRLLSKANMQNETTKKI